MERSGHHDRRHEPAQVRDVPAHERTIPDVDHPSPLIRACARIATSAKFEVFTILVILANAVVLGLETYDRVAQEWGGTLNTLNDVFLGYFAVEIAIRLVAHGRHPGKFFRNGWNAFDFIVVGAAFVPGVRENATLLRVVRLLRVFRLVSVLPEMRVLVQGLVRSIAPLGSMGLLTLLMLYVYAMFGWIAFGDQDPKAWGNVGRAMLTLFGVLTLEGWPDVQAAAREIHSWAWIYFVSFVLLSSFVLVNMVIAVVINSVEDARAAVAQQELRQKAERALEEGREEEILQHLKDLRASVEGIERQLAQRRA
jgi:voltage-gated sodium channel